MVCFYCGRVVVVVVMVVVVVVEEWVLYGKMTKN